MTSKLTRERLQEIAEDGFLKHSESKELARMALAAMDQKPALHRYRRKAVEPYGPYPWHYEVFVDYPRSVECIEDEYFYAAPPVVTGFAVDGEPAENHIGSKNALDAIVSFIKSKSNPTVKCYEEVSEQLFKDNCHGIHSHVIEYILKLGEELEDFRAEQAGMPPAQPAADSEPVAEVVSIYGDPEAFGEREIIPLVSIQQMPYGTKLYRHAQPALVVPDDVLDALQKVARIRLDMNDFDGDRRGIADCLCDAEEALIEVVNRRAAMLQTQPQNAPQNIPEIIPDCWCRTCRPVVLNDMRFVVCPDCGNKRCPRANDHRNACTGSNEPGQKGSAYPAAPQSPGGDHATVPGKWIPVSERMPEDEQEVLTINKMGHRFVSFFDKHSGLFFDRLDAPAACCIERVLVTHWMPLPAAPQEVKSES
ncbi:Eaa1 [Klebsiella pneumoniae]|nr:DUF551 domain-containing protein [Klebsiella pneumoniae]SXG40099.1 Eaa1 [Klebsiella pneumoniae]